MTVEEEVAAIEAAELNPASQSADGVSEQNRSAADLIALYKHKRALQAEAAGVTGLKIFQIVPSGAVR